MRRLVLNFLLIVLEVSLNSTLNNVYQSTKAAKILSKESFELNLRQRSFDYLVPTLVLMPTKADPTVEQQYYKWNMVVVAGANDIYRSDFHTFQGLSDLGRLA